MHDFKLVYISEAKTRGKNRMDILAAGRRPGPTGPPGNSRGGRASGLWMKRDGQPRLAALFARIHTRIMPPISGAATAPLTLVPSPHSIQPAGRSHAPFALVRGEHQSRVDRASRCRTRIARTARLMLARTGRAPRAADLAKLERDTAKLGRQTAVRNTLGDVLTDRTLRAYLPEVDARQARHRRDALLQARQAPAGAPGQQGAAVAHVLECATALEATAGPLRALGGAYRDGGGRVELSAGILRQLLDLSTGMKMLRPHGQDPADFLYPAVKLMHRAQGGESGGETALAALLRDLSASGRHHPDGLRAQLARPGGGLDFWLAHHSPDAYGRNPGALRQGLADDIHVVLDGVADAAWRVLQEDLHSQVPSWARQAQPALFEEAGVLHASAQRWHARLAMHGSTHALLRSSPADTVRLLLEHAANETLGASPGQAGDLGALPGRLSDELGRIGDRIQRALDDAGVAGYASPAAVAALRRTLMHKVLEETGILGEIHRARSLADASVPRAPSRAPIAADVAGPARATSKAMRAAEAPALHPKVAKRMKRAEADAQRQIVKVLLACRQAGDKPLSPHKLQALHEARAWLGALHGDSAPAVWQRLLDGETRRLGDRDLRSLAGGALSAHIQGGAHLTAKVKDANLRAAADTLLGDLRTAVRTASAKRNGAPLLKTACASLATPAGASGRTAFFLQLQALRERIGMLDDRGVGQSRLLEACVEELSDAELKALLGVPPASGKDAGAPDDAQAFLERLQGSARAQADKRMDTLRDSLVQDFRTRLFKQAGFLHAMLYGPADAGVPLADTLESLIRDAVRHAGAVHEQGQDTAAASRPARFVRTLQGYDVAGDLTRTLCQEALSLHARLDAGMHEVGIPSFRPGPAAAAWRTRAVDDIVARTGIWDRLDSLAHRLPRDVAEPADANRRPGLGWLAPLSRGRGRHSSRSARSVGSDGYAISKPFFGFMRRKEPTRAAGADAYAALRPPHDRGVRAAIHGSDDEPVYATIDESPDDDLHAVTGARLQRNDGGPAAVSRDESGYGRTAPRPPLRPAPPPPAAQGHRASTATSDDSGFGEYGGSGFSIDGHLYEALQGPLPAAGPARAAASATPGGTDPELAATLRAALRERGRAQWLPA